MKFYRLLLVFIAVLIGIVLISLNSTCKKQDAKRVAKDDSEALDGMDQSLFTIRYRPKWHPQAQFAGTYMAHKKGFYKNYGLNVETQPVIPDDHSLSHLIQGNSDIILIDLLTALKAYNDSTRLVNLAQVSQNISIMLVAKKSRGINSIGDFNGKKIGLWQSGALSVTELFLKQNSLQMEIVPINWSVSLFLQDAVDVINVMRYNEYHQLIQAGLTESELFTVSLSDKMAPIPEEGFYTTKAFYEKYPRQCQAFAEATMDGWMYALSNQAETIDTVLEIMNQAKIRANRPHQEWMLSKMKDVIMADPQNIGKLTRKGFNDTVKLVQTYTGRRINISYEEFVPHAGQD